MMDMRENLDAIITRALEKQPEVVVSADFAGRVMRSLPPAQRRRKVQVGRVGLVTGMFALLLAMFVLAPHATPQWTNFAFDVEMLLLVQMAGIGWLLKADGRQ
jgi:hypothetical protein